MKKIVGLSIISATILLAGGDIANMDNRYDDGLRAEIEALKAEIAELKKSHYSKKQK
jgi:hypothetical protein